MRHNTRFPRPAVSATAAVLAAVSVAAAACAPDERPAAPETSTTNSTTNSTANSTANSTTTENTENTGAPHMATSREVHDEVKDTVAFGTERAQQQPSPDAELVVRDVRVGSHEGFDRVVFEYEGTGTPGFVAGFTPEPLQQASGLPLEVSGGAFLELMIQGTPMGMLSPREDLIATGPMGLSAGSVQEVTHGGVFEADSQYVIGLDQQRPYRVYTLDNPARVVVDIQK